jgi:hypothetical protein
VVLARSRQQDGHVPVQASRATAAVPATGLTPASVLALQRTAGNRATRQALQRMIVAIDGDTDSAASKRATRACLWNLRNRKGGAAFAGADARGAVAGPAVRSKLGFHMRPLLASEGETIYVLAHGSRYSASIGDMSPTEMAAWLRERFSHRDVWALGWLGVTTPLDTPFTGKIKLVSCHSAAESRHRSATDAATIYPFPRSYAEELARALAPTSRTDPFRPSSVEGINGIGWVDEISGAITAIDKGRYDAATKTMSDNSDVGALPSAGTTANPFTGEGDPARRGGGIHAVFGAPVEANVDPKGGLRTGKGDWGKRRFAVGTGREF